MRAIRHSNRPMGVTKLHNEYEPRVPDGIFEKTPKAVWAALVASFLERLGIPVSDEAMQGAWIVEEWWTLHEAGIIPQKPPYPRVHPEDLTGVQP